MRYAVVVLMLIVAVALTWHFQRMAAGRQTEKSEAEQSEAGQSGKDAKPEKTDDEPLLLLDDDPPLLLDDDPPLLLDDDDPTGEKKLVADNSRCHHCHLNYVDEKLAVVHAKANIGCADCHGNCDEHIADESWASGGNGTAPEKMYPRNKINSFCHECHTAEKFGKLEHKDFLAGTTKEKYCTDCHGDHRLKKRTCKWR